MVMPPVTQGVEPPTQFGEWLSETARQITRPTLRPKKFTATEISAFEKYIGSVGNMAELWQLFVDFVRRAGQDDEAALAFENWTREFGLLAAFNELELIGAARLVDYAADLIEIVDGWHRMADAGLIEPDLPRQLAERVAHLDSLIRNLTEEITRQYDNDLVARLLMRIGKQRQLTLDEQLRLADAVSLDWKVKEEPSLRRADWYGADGR